MKTAPLGPLATKPAVAGCRDVPQPGVMLGSLWESAQADFVAEGPKGATLVARYTGQRGSEQCRGVAAERQREFGLTQPRGAGVVQHAALAE